MSVTLYGIPNCDSVKKARKWLEAEGIDYAFHDYKKQDVPEANLRRWVETKGWELLLNRRGTTFRKLDESDKADIDAEKAIALMLAHPSMIKRPVVEHGGGLLVGFDAAEWAIALQ
ncbi:ArsC family reductase [Croceicoccus naphthovorans]|uniref:ArsC family transcriptional regulator n=1 Tax=Croceicoccus naphthovorans TaxID=1348774 RepID=A0A0G3XEN2_9SPHN|nr:ArsC family reductase [Croceicoccus naphthovorans]AKM09039.1 ArsC family transcriptional regulator [Croceicoccus naphthovorans]MBB3991466.1 Spx/MgsR family transcriptional regulator [Croceicoccus naphthovorans]